MQRLKSLEEEGQRFLEDTGYGELDDLAKMNANAYMKGLKDGKALASMEVEKPDPAAV